jgi:caa(3)-type oxidase subunit IV
MDILLNVLVCFGLLAVSLCFVFLLPLVGNVLVSVFSTVMAEQKFTEFKGIESGTVTRRIDNPPPPVEEVHDEDDHHGPASVQTYVSVYGALLVLTVATVGVSELGLVQRDAVIWALIVASMKAGLVLAWFMHVKGGPSVNRMILTTTLFFMMVFFGMTMADLGTRDLVFADENHSEFIREAKRDDRVPAGWSDRSDAFEVH